MIRNLWITDAEYNGLEPDRIHVLSVIKPDGSGLRSTFDYEDIKRFLSSENNVIIGQNFIRFDSYWLEKILSIKIKAKMIDLLAISWALYQKRAAHSVESWGEDLGFPKVSVTDWDNLTPEQYGERCEGDIEIQRRMWNEFWKLLVDLYGTDTDKIWEYLEYLSMKMYFARLKEESGWDVDLDFLKDAVDKLQEEQGHVNAAAEHICSKL